MSGLSMVLLSISLAMDAFAVSITTGITLRDLRVGHAAKTGFFFGFFQFLMPLLGYLAGSTISVYIESFDHWIAFLLLSVIGGKMVFEAFHEQEGQPPREHPTNTGHLLVLSVATSIDALAVGISLAFLKANIWTASLCIGLITFALSFVGVMLGKRLGEKFQKRAEIVGGVVLVGIGIKILVEHLFGL